jgi:hypothetical protein
MMMISVSKHINSGDVIGESLLNSGDVIVEYYINSGDIIGE